MAMPADIIVARPHYVPIQSMSEICVAMSGGVDSSVAALISHRQPGGASGIYAVSWREDGDKDCSSASLDAQDAYSVAASLGMAMRTVDLCADYSDLVFKDFIDQYRQGLTPNPDVLCNSEVKFRGLLEAAMADGAECLVTGHYVGSRPGSDGIELLQATDQAKDQSYFLYRLTQAQLAKARFPLANMRKGEVRDMAARAGLVTCDKKDSTGICFIGERQLRPFLSKWIRTEAGDICTPEGVVLGQHQGACLYTIGQRQGLGIGGQPGGSGAWYVCGKDIAANRLYVVQEHDHPLLLSRSLGTRSLHWIGGEPPEAILQRCSCRLRHGGALVPCSVEADGDSATVRLGTAQRAAAPGQSAVFYHDGVCLGGAIIALGEDGRALAP